jgi:two-component system sensor histidine kinase LytS
MITLAEELEQTRRYLTIEKARFGEDRIVETENVGEGLERLMVPPFSVQPIVENAVRHAMRDEGPLHIDVHAADDGDDVLVAVADDGLGMDDAVAQLLLAEAAPDPTSPQKGTGIALKNVADRIERFYGVGSGIEIVSKLGEGTVVTMRLADAVLTLE